MRIPIEGMTCNSCVGRITRTLRKLDGVETATVDLGTDSATVTFDPARISLATIAEAIERAGYEARRAEAKLVIVPTPRGFLARLGLAKQAAGLVTTGHPADTMERDR